MKPTIIVYTLLLAGMFNTLYGQSAQFAVVRPDGSTSICPTLDSAYRKALDNDAIYIPGGTYTLSDSVKKKLTFWGAGISPDSTLVTGRTVISSKVLLAPSASGSAFHGIAFTFNFCSFFCDVFSVQGYSVTNVFFKNCELFGIGGVGNSLFKQCIIKNTFSCNNSASYNCLLGYVVNTGESLFFNCIFLTQSSNVILAIQTRFENSVFLTNDPFQHGSGMECGNILVANLKVGPNTTLAGGCANNPPAETGTLVQSSADDVFVNFPSPYQFGYQFDYRLKPTCLGHNAGTDNTDMGIYGGSSPARAGWVPDNPHIYYKNVGTESNTNGQLQIQFKVRTAN